MNIPSCYLSKLNTYVVDIHGVDANAKAIVIDQPDMVETHVSNLSWSLGWRRHRVVGVDVHSTIDNSSFFLRRTPVQLVLCGGDKTLLIQLNNINKLPSTLTKFLGDNTICFVGSNIERKLSIFRSKYPDCCPNFGVEVGYLAAKAMKKPRLEAYGLEELGGMVGIDTSRLLGGGCSYWKLPRQYARVFSEEDIKCAIHNACACYAIGNKLLGMV